MLPPKVRLAIKWFYLLKPSISSRSKPHTYKFSNVLFWIHCVLKRNIWDTSYENSYELSMSLEILGFTQCLKQHLFPSTLIRLSVFSSNYCHCTEQLYLTNLIWYLFNCLISNYFYKLLNVLLKIYTINIFRFCNS